MFVEYRYQLGYQYGYGWYRRSETKTFVNVFSQERDLVMEDCRKSAERYAEYDDSYYIIDLEDGVRLKGPYGWDFLCEEVPDEEFYKDDDEEDEYDEYDEEP